MEKTVFHCLSYSIQNASQYQNSFCWNFNSSRHSRRPSPSHQNPPLEEFQISTNFKFAISNYFLSLVLFAVFRIIVLTIATISFPSFTKSSTTFAKPLFVLPISLNQNTVSFPSFLTIVNP